MFKLPKGLKKTKQPRILAEGEVTGHAHRFSEGATILIDKDQKERFVEITKPSDLTHEEHAPFKFDEGVGTVEVQRQWQLGAVQRAAD